MLRRSSRGFSLLEVMVAVAILGLVLTILLSAQTGVSMANRSAANVGMAITVGRCKMTELEEKLLKLGYQEIDQLETDDRCCDDGESAPEFRCDTRVEKVELPNPPSNTFGDGGSSSLPGMSGLGLGATGSSGAAGSSGGDVGGLINAAMNPGGSGALNLDGGLSSIGNVQGQLSAVGGADGILSMVMGIVYPSLKIMMEASIRRVTVAVKWKEGIAPKTFTLVQYVTNPSRGGFVSGVDPSLNAGAAGAAGAAGTAGSGSAGTAGTGSK
ncbi:MAG: prepilin-type N-terminal cleavage/methylation domain-containing protein [Polyangiaceae bacterium]